MTEDFKLDSGTWVSVGTLRAQAVAAASPLIFDCVVCGQDKPFVAAARLAERAGRDAADGQVQHSTRSLADPKLRDFVRDKFAAHNKAQSGTSSRIKRVLLMAEPPSIDGHEITDKGYVNQRATLERRKALVDRLYQGGADVIDIP